MLKQTEVVAIRPMANQTQNDMIFHKVCDLLAPYNRADVIMLRETAIGSDIEVDSVTIFDFIMEVEDTYDITFPLEIVGDLETIGDLVDTIRTLKAA